MKDTIYRQDAVDAFVKFSHLDWEYLKIMNPVLTVLESLPPAEPEYEPVTAEDFAKTMSENTLYGFMAWHGEALELMERQGFVICKKTM